jgi:acetoin:2,6-dichlorophenolindophenol oxidoreductase subunit beta
MTELRVIDAIRVALDEAMADDAAVCLLGEDITLGGPFGATKGLVDRYGEWRVRNTPISEGTVLGLAVGAALAGLRPVVEVMFVDFITLAMDQLVNHAAKLHYMSGGQLKVPLTIRAQFGAVGGMGAHHSQSLEAWFAHVPGLKVVSPSTPADAKGLLRAAIRDDNPVLFLEHRGLYWERGEAPEGIEVSLGQAVVRRAGRDVTVVSWSRTVATALDAAAALAGEGLDVEVVDLRTLAPFDLETVVGSVRRTGRLVVAHEAVETGGLGAEIAAAVASAASDALRAPAVRVGAPFVPVPASPELEALFVPSAERLADAIRRVAARTTAPLT